MSTYLAQLQRLFSAADRVLCLDFVRGRDWSLVAGLLQGLTEELELPLPAVSVQGKGGLRLWFALEQVPAAGEGAAFLAGLGQRYLADLPPGRLSVPAVELVFPPQEDASVGGWTAFIDPALGEMFADEPWLVMAPGLPAQADLLAQVRPISLSQWRAALGQLSQDSGVESNPPATSATPSAHPAPAASHHAGGLNVGGPHADPVSFLLALMNDNTAAPQLRLEAAKALLPWWHGREPHPPS